MRHKDSHAMCLYNDDPVPYCVRRLRDRIKSTVQGLYDLNTRLLLCLDNVYHFHYKILMQYNTCNCT